jgi:pantoate--beta-alanine ligase
VRTVHTVAELRAALAEPRAAGRTIGLVPTMGAFHEGHLSLMRRARGECDLVVVSLFVNPAQFAPTEDLDAYPRDEARDAALAAEQGADLLFAPSPDEVYPDGYATTVTVSGITDTLCGAARGPEHFAGVATVVAKLFNMVGPHVAYFGQKDAQQVLVIKRLVRDLDMPVRVEVCPTVREPDGLAMSSRNAYLGPEERRRATALNRALNASQALVDDGERDADTILAAAREVLAEEEIEPEYLELVSTTTLQPLAAIESEGLLAVAARVGSARLIDNAVLRTAPAPRVGVPAAAGIESNGRP